MDFTQKKSSNYFLCDTQVENLFLGEYMLDAPGDYVKVYLLALMYVRAGEPADNLSLAKQLSLSAETVDKAWKYWEEKGVAARIAKNGGGYTVEIANLKELIFGHCAADSFARTPAPARIDLTDKELSKLLNDIQSVTGRLLESREPETIAQWVSELSIAPEVVLYCYRYCVEKGKSSRYRYVEKILLDWREKNLNTAAAVEEYLQTSDKQYEVYRRVLKELGFRRNPTEPEKRMMQRWFSQMGYSLDDVLDACKATTGISNPSFNYLDSVLTNRFRDAHKDANEVPSNSYSKIQALYEKTRQQNAERTAQIRKEIFMRVPRLAEISDEIKDCGYSLAMAMLSQNAAELENIKQKQAALEAEKKQLLRAEGYAPDALDPIFSCKKCQDTGVLEDGTACSCYGEKLLLIK